MIKIGITGQSGFLGTHLFNTLGLYPDEFERVPFEDKYFDDHKKLTEFAGSCDVIVHLAALNRHNDQEIIYETNKALVEKLIAAMDEAGNRPHVIFSSSIQEDRFNPYGQSKKEGRQLLTRWAEKNEFLFTGLVFPNIFGPFGRPYYNSFIATFSHQLTHGEEPSVDKDGLVPLIYVGEAVRYIIDAIRNRQNEDKHIVPEQGDYRVTEVLEKLKRWKEQYFEKGEIPCLQPGFDVQLFNTFRCYIDPVRFNPFSLEMKTDERGSFVETVKTGLGGQVSFSTTKPGITRGDHFHTRKIERFAVIKGKAIIRLRRIGTDKVLEFHLDGNKPAFVDMPIWYTHNITNTGDENLYTIFWINEFFDPNDPDTFYEKVEK